MLDASLTWLPLNQLYQNKIHFLEDAHQNVSKFSSFKQKSLQNPTKMPKVNEKKTKPVEVSEVTEQAKPDVTMFIGDSNLRNTYNAHKRFIGEAIGDNIFEQAMTNESIKMLLSGCNIEQIGKVVIGTILNEVAWRCRSAAEKDRDEVLLKTVKDQVEVVSEFSTANPSVSIVILCPLPRGDPEWMDTKVPEVTQKLKEEFGKLGNDKITFAQPTMLELSDIAKDKVHLTPSGMKKYLESIIGKIDADTEEEMEQDSLDWAASTSTPGKRNLRSSTKRGREEYREAEDPLKTIKRPRATGKTELSRIFDEIRELSKKMQKSNENIENYGKKLDVNIVSTTNNTKSISDLGKKVDKQEKRMDKMDTAIAQLEERADEAINENLKDVIIVRRLKHKDPIPKTKAEINTMLKAIADKMVVDMGGAADSIKFVAMAYGELDQAKQARRHGTVPAFIIGFKQKQDAISFREAGAKKAKIEGGDYHKVVFAYRHCLGSRIRTMILWKIVNKLKEEGKETWVNVNMTRPKLQIKNGEKYPLEFDFVQAITKFRGKLIDPDLKEANDIARRHYKGRCQQVFLVLKD